MIFDLDGTVLDSMEIWETVDEFFLKENNIKYICDISDKVKKLSIEESAQFFIDEFKLTHTREYVIKRIEEIVSEQYEFNIPLKPYVTEYLDMLDSKGIPYCIATATYRSLAETALRRLGILDRFKFILTCSDIGEGKTSPKVFLRAAEMLGVKPCNTAVIEDALHCIETAGKADFHVIGIKDKTSEADWKQITEISDKTISSFKELLD